MQTSRLSFFYNLRKLVNGLSLVEVDGNDILVRVNSENIGFSTIDLVIDFIKDSMFEILGDDFSAYISELYEAYNNGNKSLSDISRYMLQGDNIGRDSVPMRIARSYEKISVLENNPELIELDDNIQRKAIKYVIGYYNIASEAISMMFQYNRKYGTSLMAEGELCILTEYFIESDYFKLGNIRYVVEGIKDISYMGKYIRESESKPYYKLGKATPNKCDTPLFVKILRSCINVEGIAHSREYIPLLVNTGEKIDDLKIYEISWVTICDQ